MSEGLFPLDNSQRNELRNMLAHHGIAEIVGVLSELCEEQARLSTNRAWSRASALLGLLAQEFRANVDPTVS